MLFTFLKPQLDGKHYDTPFFKKLQPPITF